MDSGSKLTDKPGAWVDLALTLPLFVAYHVGVVFLNIKNAADYVTRPLLELANGSRTAYLGLTLAIGVLFAGIFGLLGRGQAFRAAKFAQIAIEGVVYAVAMRFGAAYIVGRLPIGPAGPMDPASGAVMSLGAGFYEELAFRVVLFGFGAKLLVWLFAHERVGLVAASPRLSMKAIAIMAAWSFAAAGIFSAAHYVGALGDRIDLASFVFRWVLGLALTLIYVARGFAAAVWSHAVYDLWVLAL